MRFKDVFLFIVVCGGAGVCIFVGSVVGNGLGSTGLFAGAVVGGIVGVVTTVLIASRLGLPGAAGFLWRRWAA